MEDLKEDKNAKYEKRRMEIEKGLITTYRKRIYAKFAKAVDRYKLIQENDKIVVCISGGKDSFLLAKCLQELQKHGKVKFELKFIVMDPGFIPGIIEKIQENANLLGINIEIFTNKIFKIASLQEKGGCYLCAKMRRGALYAIAEKLGCNKIALGHHFTDVVVTTLMNVLYGAEFKTMMPKLKSDHFNGLELIRPLYLVNEEDIINWKDRYGLEFIHCACPISEYKEASNTDILSKRDEVKTLIKNLKETNPNVEKIIFRTAHNVNLDAIIEWRKGKKKISFLDEY